MSSVAAISHHGRFSVRDQRWAQILIFSGWSVALLYFPSGLLHYYLGGKVYARDGLMGLHFAVSVWFLYRTGLLGRWLKHCWWLALIPLLVLPAAADRASAIEVFTVWKWVVLWNDWVILGVLAALTWLEPRGVVILGVLTAILLFADAAAGFREYQTNQFFLPIKNGDKSALGVALSVNEVLGGRQIRLNGLQRDVFSFANLMAAATVGGLAAASASRVIAWRCVGWICSLLFGTMLYLSGGRSAFFGVAAAAFLAIAVQTVPEQARRWTRWALLGWLIFAIFVSFCGVGELSDHLSEMFFKHQRAGSTMSAHMRDRAWEGLTGAIVDQPVVLMSGAPLAASIDSRIAPFYHWADNEYLWLLYHTGLPGALAVVLFFRGAAARDGGPDSGREGADTVFALFLFFVMGEGIARESLSFLGCLPLFVVIGFRLAPRARGRRPTAVSGRLEVPV